MTTAIVSVGGMLTYVTGAGSWLIPSQLREGDDRPMIGAKRGGETGAGQFARASRGDRRVGWSFLRKWEQLCLGREFPGRQELTAEAMGELWPHIFIVDVRSGLQESRFDYCGPIFAAACGGASLTGQPLSGSLPEALWETMPYAFQAVINAKKAIISSHHSASPGGADFAYRCVVAPAGEDTSVDYLVGAFSYRRPG